MIIPSPKYKILSKIFLNPPKDIQDAETKDRMLYLTIFLITAILATLFLTMGRIVNFLLNPDPKIILTIIQASLWVVILFIIFLASKTRFYKSVFRIVLLVPLLQPWSNLQIYLTSPDADQFMVNATMIILIGIIGFSFFYNEISILIYTLLSSINLFLFYYIILGSPIYWLIPKYISIFCIATFSILGIRYRSKLFQELEISNRSLKTKNFELSCSNKELEQFASILSHDLKNPIQSILGYSEILQSMYIGKTMDNQASEFLDFTIENAKRMSNLIDEILEFSLITKKEDFEDSIDLNDILTTVKMNLGILIKKTGGIICTEQLPIITGNRTQLIRLFQNLIENAIKYCDKKPPEIEVKAVQQNGFWRISIKDNGVGIKPEHYQKIFLMYQRLHTQKTIPGTGIGLAVCKKIVEQHGGTIWLDSDENIGSTFFFTIPIKDRK